MEGLDENRMDSGIMDAGTGTPNDGQVSDARGITRCVSSPAEDGAGTQESAAPAYPHSGNAVPDGRSIGASSQERYTSAFNAAPYPTLHAGQEGRYGSQASGQAPAYGNYQFSGDTPPHRNPSEGSAFTEERIPKQRKEHPLLKKVLSGTAIAAVFGLVASLVFNGTTLLVKNALGPTQTQSSASSADSSSSPAAAQIKTSSSSSSGNGTVTKVVEEAMPAMVAITTQSVQQVQDFFSGQTQDYTQESAGSGIIISITDDTVYIATNAHVVSGAESLSIAFTDDTAVSGTIKGEDDSADLAVVAVSKSDISSDTLSKITSVTVDTGDDLTVGQQVVAIGNALDYGQSVSTGIISALNREVRTDEAVTTGLIQTDAAINPGNSGGALLNMDGKLIGINEAKYADTNVEGMGFAIPASKAETILEQLISGKSSDGTEYGKGDAYLGIKALTVSSDYASAYGIPDGVYVSDVASGSPAEKAGIRKGDVITKIGSDSVASAEGLEKVLANYSSGTEQDITVERDDNGSWTEKTLSVTFGTNANAA